MSKEVEEAIKIVENIKIGLMNFNELINDNKEIMDSVETVLNYIKRLEAKIKRYEKYLDNKDKKFKEALEYEYQERETDYISKQVIRDKIEELKMYIYKGTNAPQDFLQYRIKAKIQVLNELLESEE